MVPVEVSFEPVLTFSESLNTPIGCSLMPKQGSRVAACEVGMRLDVLDRKTPRLTCVATVALFIHSQRYPAQLTHDVISIILI